MATNGLIINSNPQSRAATEALRETQGRLNMTMKRLQTGKRITGPGDDAGGLGVSMKEKAEIERTIATNQNVSNALAYINTQDGIMAKVADGLNRISALIASYSDATKSASDKKSYSTEFKEIKAEILSVINEKFNGVSLFATSASQTITVVTTQDASKTLTISKANLASTEIATITALGTLSATDATIANITSAIGKLAELRAEASGKASRLTMVQERLGVNETNLSAALSLIVDADVAEESTKLSRDQILVQSGVAMLAQANQQPQAALRLLG